MTRWLALPLRIVLWVLFLLVTYLVLLFNGALWIRLEPPASALLTMPKLVYPNLVGGAVYAYVVVGAIAAFALLKEPGRGSTGRTRRGVLATVFVTCLLSVVSGTAYICKLRGAEMVFANDSTRPLKVADGGIPSGHGKAVMDLAKEWSYGGPRPGEFMLYLPKDRKGPIDVVAYMAYGNWLTAPKGIAGYLVDWLTANGYGAVVFTGRTRATTDFAGIVKDIRRMVALLRERSDDLGIRRIILSGGSAGANLALSAAYAGAVPEFAVDGVSDADARVDGVIAFYPFVDMLYNYHYFTDKRDSDRSLLDKWGDGLFGMMDVNGASGIRESHELVMKGLLGGPPREDTARGYEISSPNRWVSDDAPPTLLIHGSHDSMTPVEPTRAMFNGLRDAGADAAMLELPFTDHAFDSVLPRKSVVTKKVLSCVGTWLADLDGEEQW